MVCTYFKTKNLNFGYILKDLGMENVTMYIYFKAIFAFWYILCPFSKFGAIWYIFPRFGISHHEKSGNPGLRKFVVGKAAAEMRASATSDAHYLNSAGDGSVFRNL
jgi:hypothetical protein